jgi:hypothetical protein
MSGHASFRYGIEIEFIARPLDPYLSVKKHEWYRELARALIAGNCGARYDDGEQAYRKHAEYYER